MAEENLQPDEQKEQKAEAGGEAVPSVVYERGTHKNTREHQQDNAEFLNGLDKTKPEDIQKSLERAAEWEKKGDLDLLRAAGLSLDQIKQNPLERHIRLASMFLKRDTNASGLTFRVDFHGNDMAQWDLDLGADLFASNILVIDVLDENGKVIHQDATRGEDEQGRPGFFDAKTKERVYAQQNQQVRIKQTQSNLALKDRRYGEQTYHHSLAQEMYEVKNAQKTVLKDQVRAEAAKQNQEVKTDKSFFDVFLEDILKTVNSGGLFDAKDPLKIDFSKIGQAITKLIGELGFAKIFTDVLSPASSSGKTSPGAPSGSARPASQPRSKASAAEYKESAESKKMPNINRKWLMENIGTSDAEVQKTLVKINFMGANLRVSKFIAPYLFQVMDTAEVQGINYRIDPRQTSCQKWRPITGGGAQSMHSWGVAIDINSLDNPYQRELANDKEGRQKVKTNMPPEFIALMQSVGFRHLWWDPMHFELLKNPFKNKGVLTSPRARAAAEQYLA